MVKLVLDMSMSLDGFIAGPEDGAANPLGIDGQRLHGWLADGNGGGPRTFRPDGPSGEVFDELMATGAVLVGRRTFDLAGRWNGDHHDGVRVPTNASERAITTLIDQNIAGTTSASGTSRAGRCASIRNFTQRGEPPLAACPRRRHRTPGRRGCRRDRGPGGQR